MIILMNQSALKGLRTWIEVDTKVIESNFTNLKSLLAPATKFCAVVKSNAYGHGLFEFAKTIEKIGADFLAVDSITEAIRLCKEGIKKPILILGYTLPERLVEAADNDIAITVSQFETLADVEKLTGAKALKVHIKVDTGMHRQGFLPDDIAAVIETLKKLDGKIVICGLYTHFAVADEPENNYTSGQIAVFEKWQKSFRDAGFSPLVHASASAGAISDSSFHFDMVRFGASLYGLWPSPELKSIKQKSILLEPALSWKAIVSEVKSLKKGDKVGYGLSDELSRDSRVAVCPIGYWHGYPRALSGKAEVLINGRRARIIGRVSMDMIVVDVTDIPDVAVCDVATLIGSDGKEEVSADELARLSDTINYEIITRLNPLIKKIYI